MKKEMKNNIKFVTAAAAAARNKYSSKCMGFSLGFFFFFFCEIGNKKWMLHINRIIERPTDTEE